MTLVFAIFVPSSNPRDWVQRRFIVPRVEDRQRRCDKQTITTNIRNTNLWCSTCDCIRATTLESNRLIQYDCFILDSVVFSVRSQFSCYDPGGWGFSGPVGKQSRTISAHRRTRTCRASMLGYPRTFDQAVATGWVIFCWVGAGCSSGVGWERARVAGARARCGQ